MPIRVDRSTGLAIGLIGVTTLLGLLAWPRLPPTIAIHFAASGHAGNYVPKSVGVMVLPIGMTLTLLVLRTAVRVDPPADSRVRTVILAGTMTLFTAMQAYLLGWNLGYRVPFVLVLGTIVCWAVLTVGYVVIRETARR